MATDKPRYTVSVDKELFQQIEEYRFEHRCQTRSEATVELIRLGLESLKTEKSWGGGTTLNCKIKALYSKRSLCAYCSHTGFSAMQ